MQVSTLAAPCMAATVQGFDHPRRLSLKYGTSPKSQNSRHMQCSSVCSCGALVPLRTVTLAGDSYVLQELSDKLRFSKISVSNVQRQTCINCLESLVFFGTQRVLSSFSDVQHERKRSPNSPPHHFPPAPRMLGISRPAPSLHRSHLPFWLFNKV